MKQSGNKSETKSVLFIIGNGFDLGLNMKTSYEDVYNNVLNQKDIKRQNKIIEVLGCRFFRYNETIDLLYEVK